jgi:elongation factor Ts
MMSDQVIIEKEIEIGKDQARQEGKAEELLEKIAIGKLNKFFKESTLAEPGFDHRQQENCRTNPYSTG